MDRQTDRLCSSLKRCKAETKSRCADSLTHCGEDPGAGQDPRRTVLYRGSLKSCNYQCSYCPFSKHKISKRELEDDREQWFRFCESLRESAEDLSIRALMVVPYGEALIHPWYWEGLGGLTKWDTLEGAGAQTNLSFSAERTLEIFDQIRGVREKLRLWASFHPEMTTCEEFAAKCIRLRREGILLCVGAVGVPRNIDLLRRLREMLPDEIYLWINKMDGLKRPYTEAEIRLFQSIDPYFDRELRHVPADERLCLNRLFVEADGNVRRCNISGASGKNWYGGHRKDLFEENFLCRRKWCSCYLAYGLRDEETNQALFGPDPVFRIPRRTGGC